MLGGAMWLLITILCTLVLMNLFIAVISNVYDEEHSKAVVNWERELAIEMARSIRQRWMVLPNAKRSKNAGGKGRDRRQGLCSQVSCVVALQCCWHAICRGPRVAMNAVRSAWIATKLYCKCSRHQVNTQHQCNSRGAYSQFTEGGDNSKAKNARLPIGNANPKNTVATRTSARCFHNEEVRGDCSTAAQELFIFDHFRKCCCRRRLVLIHVHACRV